MVYVLYIRYEWIGDAWSLYLLWGCCLELYGDAWSESVTVLFRVTLGLYTFCVYGCFSSSLCTTFF